jgi:hypothetical protein
MKRESILQGFCGKPEGKRPHGKPRRRWKDIKMCLSQIQWKLIWFRIGNNGRKFECGDERSCPIKCRKFLD